MNSKVSIIVPIYNTAKYLEACLNSIKNQTYENLEIILVDDGSTDNTLEIINDKLSASKINHKIIHQENKGVSSARNRGIAESCGDYIVFVDADDYILTDHLYHLYNPDYDFNLIQLVKKDEDKLSKTYFYKTDEMTTEEFIKLELEMKIPFNFVQLSYNATKNKYTNVRAIVKIGPI